VSLLFSVTFCLAQTNTYTLAYYAMELITAVIWSMIQAPRLAQDLVTQNAIDFWNKAVNLMNLI
jgi:hypothetical protein